MPDFVFFYGTLMLPFQRPGRSRIDQHLRLVGRGTIRAALFDLGIYPAAVPTDDSTVRGEVHEVLEPLTVLRELDGIEGYRSSEPENSLYTRRTTTVSMDAGGVLEAWVYYYNAPLGRAERIVSGDYLEHLKGR